MKDKELEIKSLTDKLSSMEVRECCMTCASIKNDFVLHFFEM
jgi:hypothetical protein